MAVSIHIPTPMRPHTEGQAVVDVPATTVQTALDALGAKYPAVVQRLFDKGQLRRFINIYVNDEDIRYLENLKTTVKDGDQLAIIPAVAGG
jgi:molybdopterin synthase sulfur carrier subunit